jgi:acyl dehydratase
MSRRELATPPNLLPLYARAAATAPLRRGSGSDLPDSELVLRAQRLDADRLAAYQRLCGFRVQDVLPPTYLHVLAFPISVALMTEPSFPFALAGLVHVGNVIEQRRPVTSDELVTLRVRAADLRAHRVGRQIDLLTDVTVGNELVWRSRSTYLRPGKPTGPKEPRVVTDPPPGPAALIRVPGDTGRRYAAISGDRNPIHLYPLTARAFGFPRAIVHGMWLKARVLAALEGRLPDAFSVDVAFKAPVLLPSTVSFVAAQDDGTWRLDVRSAKSGRPHLIGTISPIS